MIKKQTTHQTDRQTDSGGSMLGLTGQVSLPCNMLLLTQLLYNLPLMIRDTSLLVSSGTNCLNLFQPILILACTAASASHGGSGVETDLVVELVEVVVVVVVEVHPPGVVMWIERRADQHGGAQAHAPLHDQSQLVPAHTIF